MGRLAGKVALITGSGRGIGRGIALCLAAEGADIVINDLTARPDVEATAQEIRDMGRQALVWPADISNRDAVAAMIAGAVASWISRSPTPRYRCASRCWKPNGRMCSAPSK